eukprot:m.523733 g.523733  ORF g.523733 m.523733 type:complete len:362 (-) comp21979_c0_seq5:1144-2229(-)
MVRRSGPALVADGSAVPRARRRLLDGQHRARECQRRHAHDKNLGQGDFERRGHAPRRRNRKVLNDRRPRHPLHTASSLRIDASGVQQWLALALLVNRVQHCRCPPVLTANHDDIQHPRHDEVGERDEKQAGEIDKLVQGVWLVQQRNGHNPRKEDTPCDSTPARPAVLQAVVLDHYGKHWDGRHHRDYREQVDGQLEHERSRLVVHDRREHQWTKRPREDVHQRLRADARRTIVVQIHHGVHARVGGTSLEIVLEREGAGDANDEEHHVAQEGGRPQRLVHAYIRALLVHPRRHRGDKAIVKENVAEHRCLRSVPIVRVDGLKREGAARRSRLGKEARHNPHDPAHNCQHKGHHLDNHVVI